MNRRTHMTTHAVRFALGLVAVATFVASCSSPKSQTPPPEPEGITKTYERGPLALTLTLDKKEITTADVFALELTATLPEGYEAALPDPDKKLGELSVRDQRESRPRLEGTGKVAIARQYTLEPFLAGEYKVPPLKVQFWKTGESEKHDAETEELSVSVTSVLPQDGKQPTLREILSPVGLPRSYRWLLYLIPAALGGAVASILVLLLRRRRGKERVALEKQIPPHERALSDLEALIAARLVEQGDYKEFYFRLSLILRRYIEGRFGLHAPERTTEEFLTELGASDALTGNHKLLLRDFLKHCDLVKFAKLEPGYQETQEATDSCRRFVLDTIPQPVERAA